MPRFVIYARKSTESEDRQVLSIDSQVQELKAMATRQGIAVAEVLTEAHSAKSPGRPVFTELMRRIRRGEIQGIIAWKMDRLARNHLDTGTVLQALSDGSLERVITSDRTYTPDGNDRFIGHFELGIATKFIDDLRANTKRGLRAKLHQGWLPSIPPLGYLNDEIHKTIITDPKRFTLVRRMWELMLTGAYRPDAIIQIANKQWGFTTRKFKRIGGRPLSHSTIYRMFRDPFYMGIIHHRPTGEDFVGAHKPMVSREEFHRVQQILQRDGRPRPQRHEFPFTGLIRCGNCSSFITAERHVKKSGLVFTYYRCSHRKMGISCREPAVSSGEMERQIVNVLARLVVPGRVLGMLRSMADRVVQQESEAREAARRAVAGRLSAIRGELERLLDLRLHDLIDEETFAAKKQLVERRRAEFAETLRGADSAHAKSPLTAAEVFDFAGTLRNRFLSGTSVQKRIIFEAVGLNPTLRARKLSLSLKNPYEFLAHSGSMSNWGRAWQDVRTWLLETTDYVALPNLDDLPSHEGIPRRARAG